MTEKDIEKMLAESEGLDMSHVNKDDALAKARRELYFGANVKSEQKEEKSSFARFFTSRRIIPALAGAALAIGLFAGAIGLYNENFQTVYIDINPSVALKLNRFDRVIGVEYLNDDAKALLSDVKLVGKDATDALSTVIDACDNAGYVKDDSEIYISATSKEEKKSEKLLNKLKVCAENMKENDDETYLVNTFNAKKGDKEKFDKSSISPAKYNIIEDILDEDDAPFKFEDLKDKPMDELRKIKRDYEDRDDDDDDDDDDDYRENGAHKENSDHGANREDPKENGENGNPPSRPNDDDDDDDEKGGKPFGKEFDD